MERRKIAFNGKFLSAPQTGVHRVARELLIAIDEEMRASPALGAMFDFSLICPRDAAGALPLQSIPATRTGIFTWQLWEQFDLPRLARDQQLVSLCNLAPLAKSGGVTLIHDAQVYLSPLSYSLAFRSWYRLALPRIGRASAAIITVSEFSRANLAKLGVAPPEKIFVAHNGVDHMARITPDASIVNRLGLTPMRYAIGLANVQKHKNISVILKAFANEALSDVQLVLVGKASERDFAAAGMPAPRNVIFAGAASDEELRALYENAACVAFPSTTEGFGLPPLEAMYVGCPAIVAPCGALPEICGGYAEYAAPDDAEAWSKAILSMADDHERRRALAVGAKAHAETFTWRKSAKKVLDVLVNLPRAAEERAVSGDKLFVSSASHTPYQAQR